MNRLLFRIKVTAAKEKQENSNNFHKITECVLVGFMGDKIVLELNLSTLDQERDKRYFFVILNIIITVI